MTDVTTLAVALGVVVVAVFVGSLLVLVYVAARGVRDRARHSAPAPRGER